MQGARIQPTRQGKILIDVVCDCGANGLADKRTGEKSFKHEITLGAGEVKTFICDICQSEYAVVSQNDHIHVTNHVPPANERILFYEGTRYFLSNFSSFRVRWCNADWMTSEHAYQAAKFDDFETVHKIKNAASAYEAKKLAQMYKDRRVVNWSAIKLDVMEDILRAKLAQHPYIQKKLRESGQREIIENSPTDSFWGRGPDWKGQNNLGKLWMKLRAEM